MLLAGSRSHWIGLPFSEVTPSSQESAILVCDLFSPSTGLWFHSVVSSILWIFFTRSSQCHQSLAQSNSFFSWLPLQVMSSSLTINSLTSSLFSLIFHSTSIAKSWYVTHSWYTSCVFYCAAHTPALSEKQRKILPKCGQHSRTYRKCTRTR